MPERRVRRPPRHMHRRRKGRVHDDDIRLNALGQIVVDLCSIMPEKPGSGEQGRQQVGTARRVFIESQGRTRQFGEDGQKTGPGGRLQHMLAACDTRRPCKAESKRQRRRELLPGLAVLRATRL